MTSRQAGHRISAAAAPRRSGGGDRRSRRAVSRGKSEPLSAWEKRCLLRLLACGGIFVLLVAAKILLPDQMKQWNQTLSGVMEQNMDVQAVFSAVGRAVSGESDVNGTLEDVYEAVFHPQAAGELGEVLETAAESSVSVEQPSAMETLRQETDGLEETAETASESVQTAEPPSDSAEAQEQPSEVASLAYILYSDQNLPENVSMEQAILGFDYCTPVLGTLTSNFGYREHPVEGEEKFHYGLDIAADTGTDIGCFADGVVTAVGESSSYGKYVMVSHGEDYSTLYAHCSRITVTSGTTVKEEEKIAEVGETGVATGPHLHFEIHKGETYLNPIYYVAHS